MANTGLVPHTESPAPRGTETCVYVQQARADQPGRSALDTGGQLGAQSCPGLCPDVSCRNQQPRAPPQAHPALTSARARSSWSPPQPGGQGLCPAEPQLCHVAPLGLTGCCECRGMVQTREGLSMQLGISRLWGHVSLRSHAHATHTLAVCVEGIVLTAQPQPPGAAGTLTARCCVGEQGWTLL